MIGKIHKIRSAILFSLLLVCGFVLIGRLFYLQCINHPVYASQARDQHRHAGRISPRRGSILDCRGNILASSVDCLSLYAEIPRLENAAGAAAALAPILQLDPEELEKKFSGSGWFVWVKRHLSEEEVAAVSALSLPGINFRKEMRRRYPKENLLTQVLGITDVDGNGIEGLELRFDEQLRGRPGWLISEKDSRQREVRWFRSQNVEAIDGCNLILTVDEVIQDTAEEEVEAVFQKYQANWATVLVMEPASGKILAIANRPTANPNSSSRFRPDCRRNRAVTDRIEPGSTFKVFPAAAALEAGVVGLDTRVYCEDGAFVIAGHVLHDHRPHGSLSFEEIIQKSSNIGMAKVGMLLGEEALYRSLRDFGIGGLTGVDLPGEVSGCLRPLSRWSGLSLRSITMGHEVDITPLGLLSAFSALGNGGILLKPRIVERIENSSGQVLQRFGRQVRGRAVSPETARRMLSVLKKVVEAGGTGRRAAIPGFSVAGKTGTAQKLEEGGGYSHSRYRSLFMGMFPFPRPRIAILVVVDEPSRDYYGGTVAAPVFRRVAERIIPYLDLEPPQEEAVL